MLFVKIMSAEELPDSDSTKAYRLITIGDKDLIQFGYQDDHQTDLSDYDKNTMFINRFGEPSFERYELTGNVYVMNQHGKTISTRSPYIYPFQPLIK